MVRTAAEGLADRTKIMHPSSASVSLGGRSKRALDIAVSLTALVLLSPLLLMVALLIR